MAETWWSNVSLLSKVTPRVLILSVIWTVVPATLTEVCGGKVRLRWWVLSQIASDLSGFKARPLTQNHSCSVRRHRSRRPIESYWPEEVSEMKSCVSSAYCWWWIPDELMIWPTGEVKTENRIGPSTEPWGTPVFSEVSVDFDWPTTTLWTLSAKYERIQLITLPEIPNPVWSLVKSMWWSIVSNAALRSSDTRIVGWLESAAVYTWSSVFNSDVSVEWKRR